MDTQVLHLPFSGDLDGSTRLPVRKFLLSLDTFGPISLDFSPVSSVDSSILAELVAFRRRVVEAGGELMLVGVNPSVKRLLEVTGLSVLLLKKPVQAA